MLLTHRGQTRTQERTIQPAGNDIRWFQLYDNLEEFGSALAYPCKWSTVQQRWAANTTATRRRVYSTIAGATGSAEDFVPTRYNAWGRCWEVLASPSATGSLVQVRNDLAGTEQTGDIQTADANGYHYGQIVRLVGGALVDFGACWIRFLDFESTDTGQVLGEYGRTYGPLALAGTATSLVGSDNIELPLYVGEVGEQTFLAKADSAISKGASGTLSIYHRSTETDSGANKTAKALAGAIATGKWCVVQRLRGGQWYASQWEC